MISARSEFGQEPTRRPDLHGVLDASVASRWFIPTQASPQTREVLATVLAKSLDGSERHFLVPEPFFAEVLSAVSKQSRDHAALSHCEQTLNRLPVQRIPWAQVPTGRCVELIARRVGAYDAVYAAIAIERGLPLVTSDARLARALGDPPWVMFVA
jgi:predicted nucleic acid-binding protein